MKTRCGGFANVAAARTSSLWRTPAQGSAASAQPSSGSKAAKIVSCVMLATRLGLRAGDSVDSEIWTPPDKCVVQYDPRRNFFATDGFWQLCMLIVEIVWAFGFVTGVITQIWWTRWTQAVYSFGFVHAATEEGCPDAGPYHLHEPTRCFEREVSSVA